jgi:hypothetical protein
VNTKIIQLDAPENRVNVPAQSVTVAIAWRLKRHNAGKIAGGYTPILASVVEDAKKNNQYPPRWKQDVDERGAVVWVQPVASQFDKGDLTLEDAIYATEYSLSCGLNPLAHISMWYQGGQLQISTKYSIKVGWAEDMAAFSTEFVEMADADRTQHGLGKGDLGVIAYNILDADKSRYSDTILALVQGGAKFNEAKTLALKIISKSNGVGVVRTAEMGGNKKEPKGRSWYWLAQKRAISSAISFSHGDMTPARLARSAQGAFKPIGQEAIPLLADPGYPADADEDIQAKFIELQLNDRRRQVKAAAQSPEERHVQFHGNVDLMRGAVDEPGIGDEPEAVEDGQTVSGWPTDDPDFPQATEATASDPSIWLPDPKEFQTQVAFDFGLTWDEIRVILKDGLGYTGFRRELAQEMYLALQAHFGSDKPMVPY